MPIYSTVITKSATSGRHLSKCFFFLRKRPKMPPPTAFGRIFMARRFAYPINWWDSCFNILETTKVNFSIYHIIPQQSLHCDTLIHWTYLWNSQQSLVVHKLKQAHKCRVYGDVKCKMLLQINVLLLSQHLRWRTYSCRNPACGNRTTMLRQLHSGCLTTVLICILQRQ